MYIALMQIWFFVQVYYCPCIFDLLFTPTIKKEKSQRTDKKDCIQLAHTISVS